MSRSVHLVVRLLQKDANMMSDYHTLQRKRCYRSQLVADKNFACLTHCITRLDQDLDREIILISVTLSIDHEADRDSG